MNHLRTALCALLFAATGVSQVCPHPAGVSDLSPVLQGCNDFLTPNPAPFLTLVEPLSASTTHTWQWRHVASPVPNTVSNPIAVFMFYGLQTPTSVVSVPFSTFGSGCLLAQPFDAIDFYVHDWLPTCSDAFAFGGVPFLIPPGLLPAGLKIYAQAVYQDFLDPAQRVATSQPIEIVVQP